MKLDLHHLESLANSICEDATTEKENLARMIRAYCRILHASQPTAFRRHATVYSDEDGHWDNSFPPKIVYKQHTSPLLIEILDSSENSKATSGGFYHSMEYFTEDPGLYVGTGGEFYGATITGTGDFGQFAAHPGECNVDCTIKWATLDLDDITTDRLQKAEKELRDLAFPAINAKPTNQKDLP